MESLCKEIGHEILVDEETRVAIAPEIVSIDFGKRTIRGIGRRDIHAVVALKNESGLFEPYHPKYASLIAARISKKAG